MSIFVVSRIKMNGNAKTMTRIAIKKYLRILAVYSRQNIFASEDSKQALPRNYHRWYDKEMNIGCHISIAEGIGNAPERAHDLECECFQIFSRSPQGGRTPELTPEVVEYFKEEMRRTGITNAYIHAPYYINFASTNNRIRYGSVSVIRDELERGSALGVKYIITHLGSGKDLGKEAGIKKVVEMLAQVFDGYRGSAKLLIENSAGAGDVIGDTFAEIKAIIDSLASDHIAGVCLDTQHSFASGYDWRTPESFNETTTRIDREIGLDLIKVMHANDSMTPLGSRLDRHEHIGAGYIKEEGFRLIIALANERNIDMILETKHPGVKNDIRFLKLFRDKLING